MRNSIPAWGRRPGRNNRAMSGARGAGPSSTLCPAGVCAWDFLAQNPQPWEQSTSPHWYVGTASTAHPGLFSGSLIYTVALHRVFFHIPQSKWSRRAGVFCFHSPLSLYQGHIIQAFWRAAGLMVLKSCLSRDHKTVQLIALTLLGHSVDFLNSNSPCHPPHTPLWTLCDTSLQQQTPFLKPLVSSLAPKIHSMSPFGLSPLSYQRWLQSFSIVLDAVKAKHIFFTGLMHGIVRFD